MYLYSLLSIQTTNLLLGKVHVRGIFCFSEISLAISFGCVLLLKIDSLKDYLKKNRIRLIKVQCWPTYPLGHLRVEYLFLSYQLAPSAPTFDEL